MKDCGVKDFPGEGPRRQMLVATESRPLAAAAEAERNGVRVWAFVRDRKARKREA